jgi:hypothetical protein
MENEAKNIIERMLGMSNLHLVQEDTEDPKYEEGMKKKIRLRDLGDPERRIWLSKDDGDIEKMKYDNLVITYEKDESLDLVYGIFLEYISENSLFRICEEDDEEESRVRFTIPSFSNLSELQIKLDML